MYYILFFFFFSSRRRHTRFDCDWSSDVCSSDLGGPRPLVHHAAVSYCPSPFPVPRQSHPDSIHPVRRQELAGIGRGQVDRRNPDRPPPPCPALHYARRAVTPAEPALGGRKVPVRDRGADQRR